MNKKISYLLSLALYLLAFTTVLVSCSKDDEKISPELIINSGVYEYNVSGNGGIVNISFTANTSWFVHVESYNGINLSFSQSEGGAGTYNLAITVEKNTSSNNYRNVSIVFYSDKNEWLNHITIEQSPYPILEVAQQTVSVEQLDGHAEIGVKSNIDYELIVPEEYSDWLSAVTKEGKINITCKDNDELSDRKGKIILRSEEITKEIEVVQAGGFYMNSTMPNVNSKVHIENDETSGDSYSLSPKSGEYELEIKTNIDFDLNLEDNNWLTNLKLKERINNTYTYTFNIAAQEADSLYYRQVVLNINYSNGDTSHYIEINQRGWGTTVTVQSGQSLTEQLHKLEEGYKAIRINIYGGIIDHSSNGLYEPSLKTVQEITIENVETIPDYFLDDYDAPSLKKLTLKNVKKIGASAFNCSSLVNIHLPSSLEYIGEWAFDNHNDERRVYAEMTRPCQVAGKTSLGSSNKGYLYVPLGSLNYYKSNDYWKKAFKSIRETSNL